MTDLEQQAIQSLRDKGYAVIIWTPEELGDTDIESLEDALISHGNNYINNTKEMG